MVVGLSCINLGTQGLLDADGFGIERDPPVIISPKDGDTILNKASTLTWALNQKAQYYDVQVATDINFTDLIYVARTAATSSNLTVPDALTYYWRVRSNLTTAGKYSTARIEAMDDAVYVYCAATATTCSDQGQAGNKSKPFRTITRALSEASSSGLKQIKVAARDTSATAYLEAIVLVPQVSMYGGYKSDFKDANRNVALNTTRVYNDGAIALYAAYLFSGQQSPYQQVIVDGFTFETGVTNTNTYAVYILQSSENLVLRNNTIKSGSSSGETYGLYLAEVTPVTNPNMVVDGNFIKSGSPAQLDYSSFGVYVDGGSPLIRNNVIISGNITIAGTGTSRALRTFNANATITNNTIQSGSAQAGGVSVAITMTHTTSGSNIITNNIVLATAGAGATWCFSENSATSSPASIQNNLLSDCTNFYYDQPSANTMTFWCAGLLGTTVGCGTTVTTPIPSGNVNVANFAALYLVGAGDYHIKSTTPVSVKQGGKNTATGQNTCGSGTASCGKVDTDRDSASRTLPFSIGAYEMDL